MFRASSRAQQAKFRVDALGRYLQAYEKIEGRQVHGLSDLPRFHLISPGFSLSAETGDYQSGMKDGYLYDMNSPEPGKYVISASPVGFMNSHLEFGITEDGKLRVNRVNADVMPDSYEEVQSWEETKGFPDTRTKDLPDYIAD